MKKLTKILGWVGACVFFCSICIYAGMSIQESLVGDVSLIVPIEDTATEVEEELDVSADEEMLDTISTNMHLNVTDGAIDVSSSNLIVLFGEIQNISIEIDAESILYSNNSILATVDEVDYTITLQNSNPEVYVAASSYVWSYEDAESGESRSKLISTQRIPTVGELIISADVDNANTEEEIESTLQKMQAVIDGINESVKLNISDELKVGDVSLVLSPISAIDTSCIYFANGSFLETSVCVSSLAISLENIYTIENEDGWNTSNQISITNGDYYPAIQIVNDVRYTLYRVS